MIISDVKISKDSHHPKYRQLSEGIKGLVDRGVLSPGERLPTSKELQRELRLSLVTVENALTRLVKQNYLIRRQRLGTFVNPAFKPKASRIAMESAGILAGKYIKVFFCDIALNDLYWHHILNKLENTASALGANLIFKRINSSEKYEECFLLEHTNGIVACGYVGPELISHYKNRDIPVVVIGNIASSGKRLDKIHTIAHDDEHRASLSTRHLLELGHRKIALVVGPKGSRLAENFTTGYKKAMSAYGMDAKDFKIEYVNDHSFKTGWDLGEKLILTSDKPTAVFACDDRLAIGIMKLAEKLGVNTPDDLSVLGCGDLEIGQIVSPALTTTKSYPEKSAALAMDMLTKQFNGKSPDTINKTVLRVEKILLRESTKFLMTEEWTQTDKDSV